jgi:hypothetical protein
LIKDNVNPLTLIVMRKIILLSGMLGLYYLNFAQTFKYDSVAALILDRMSNVIGDMQSCSFQVDIAKDVNDPDRGFIKEHVSDEVHLAGPDRMLIDSYGPKGHRVYCYNGVQMAYYDHGEHNYGVIDAPATIIETIDQINARYEIEFPAADFFYPAFTDDLIESSDYVSYIGKALLDGKECFHILAKGKDKNIQLWIRNDAFNLPAKYVIQYLKTEGMPQYEATFSNWQVNPELPLAMFDFMPPPGARKVRILPNTEN